ncbi:uncharacterized protein G2W53_033171 [Senna tora]|uniref:Uncharacterized protein n=1 Tax=Senna tora TaxID=362788 RepID=A0A834W6U0_9FABA|nr:uncharacterized protein G2W53_033171 [Senna tora]
MITVYHFLVFSFYPFLHSTANLTFLGKNQRQKWFCSHGSTAEPWLGSTVEPWLGSTVEPCHGSATEPDHGFAAEPDHVMNGEVNDAEIGRWRRRRGEERRFVVQR